MQFWKFRTLFVGISFLQGTACFGGEAGETRLQGIWFGDGRQPLSRTVLVIQDDKLVTITPLGAFVSTFKSNEKPTLAEIDIQRFDGGTQLGVYEFSETRLRMKLGEPNGMRPTLKEVRFPSGNPHWHTTFSRRPTSEGLSVLQEHLSSIVPVETAVKSAKPTQAPESETGPQSNK